MAGLMGNVLVQRICFEVVFQLEMDDSPVKPVNFSHTSTQDVVTHHDVTLQKKEKQQVKLGQ